MLQVKSFVFSSFGTNTYLVSDGQGDSVLIDPACSGQYEQAMLYRYIQTEHLRVRAIVATHGHLDHLWGAPWACEQWHMPVLMHPADIPMAQGMQAQYELFGIRAEAQPFPIEPLHALSPLGEPEGSLLNFRIIPTPGHTPGSVCLLFGPNILISGDTLFRMGYGRTDLSGGDIQQLITSLNRLFALPPSTVVYPGHGESTTIAAESR